MEENENVVVTSTVLTNMPTFQGYTPNVKENDTVVTINTFLYFNYDLDVLDFNNHLSAR